MPGERLAAVYCLTPLPPVPGVQSAGLRGHRVRLGGQAGARVRGQPEVGPVQGAPAGRLIPDLPTADGNRAASTDRPTDNSTLGWARADDLQALPQSVQSSDVCSFR